MTPARYASCKRLLRGISVQANSNRLEMHNAIARKDHLENECARLVNMISEDHFADSRILSSLTQRMSRVSDELNACKQSIALTRLKDMKFNRSIELLSERLHVHEVEMQEIELMELASVRVSLGRSGQSATRTKR